MHYTFKEKSLGKNYKEKSFGFRNNLTLLFKLSISTPMLRQTPATYHFHWFFSFCLLLLSCLDSMMKYGTG